MPQESNILICPYCKSVDIIKRGTAKRSHGGTVQVYGCKDCKRRFTEHDSNHHNERIDVTQYLARIKELEETNIVLLDNNVKLAEENKRLSSMTDTQHSKLLILEREKTECKQKFDVVVKEKDAKILEREKYIAELHDTVWHLKNSFDCKLYRFTELPNGFRFELDFVSKKR